MQSAPAGLWDPHGPQSKDVSSLPVHTPSASRLSHLIAAPPTKRITFYKSGDTKFAGVRMAVHKRSFKCFDALLDDLSQKVPLPFGVRTVTTPRGIHSIKHLEQLEDGGCYLCSDRRQAKPINIELAGKRPALWHHNSRRVPQRPAEDPPPPSAPSHTPTRQRRILLVRNSDPAVRRSVILSRRSARSLRVFLEGISEIMQCHVRKLYTLEGRKIDSAQSLLTCPGVLVCVGREPFRPLLLNYVAKHSEEKLPGLGTRSPGNGARSPGTGARSPGTGARSPRNGQGARSRSSVCSEGHGSKKNVNFGLETKKTIIHPLSDSSNRSTRFSLSSDKSYPNGLSSQGGKEAVLNDDIEKRVLVNKDGSLSVEMRVRFRLHNDERLQWSTEIKKSPSDSLTNDCCPLREAPPCFLQHGQSESCSDPDSASCVVEAADYTPKPPQRSLEEPQSHYACCFQRQEYDLWENPAHIQTSKHSHSRVRHTHSSSSSSSCRSSKLVRRRATHRECSELGRVVNGMVEVCTVSSSCSHSELSLGATDNQGEERPLSCSSHVLQALQDDVDDLPPSVSRCCHSNDPPQALPLTPQPPSPMSTSSRSRKHTPALQGEERGSKTSFRRSSNSCSCCRGEVTPKADEERVDSSLSKASQASHGSRSPSNRVRIPVAPEEGDGEAEQGGKRAVSVSGGSGGSIGSVGSIGSSVCSHCGGCDQGYDPVSCHSQKSHRSKRSQEEEEERSGRGLSGGSDECGFSQRTNKSNFTHFYQEGRAASMMSHMSLPEEGEDTGKEGEVEVGEKIEEGEKDERAANVLSAKCFSSVKGRTSRTSQKSKASESLADMEEQMEEPMEGEEKEGEVEDGGEQRAASIMSVKSNLSAKSSRSHTSTCSKADGSTRTSERERASPRSEPDVAEDTGAAETEERGASVMSAKTNTSANYSRSHKSTKSPNAASASSETPDVNAIETTGEEEEEEVGEKTEERLESSMSVRSNLSAKSRRSCKSTCSKAEQVLSAYSPEVPATEPEPTGEDEGEERATISTSVKSNLSAKSSRSHKSTCSRSIRVVSPKPAASETLVNDPADVVAAGALSAKTNASAKSLGSCKSTGDDEGEEREARAMSAKTRASIKFSRTHKSACKAASPKPAACETPVNDPEEKTEEEKTASALSAKTSASVRSSRSHKSTCSRSVRAETPVAKDIPAIETTEGDENGSAAAAGETEERPASAILDNNNALVKSSISHKSTCSRNVWAETPGTKDIPVITTTGERRWLTIQLLLETQRRDRRAPSQLKPVLLSSPAGLINLPAAGGLRVKDLNQPMSLLLKQQEEKRSERRKREQTVSCQLNLMIQQCPASLTGPPVMEVVEQSLQWLKKFLLSRRQVEKNRETNPPPLSRPTGLISRPVVGGLKLQLQNKLMLMRPPEGTRRERGQSSQANAKSTNQTPPVTTETKEEPQSHATSRPASTAAHRDDDVRDHVTEKKAPSVRSKSPAKAEGDSRVASFARSTRSKVKVQKASEAQDDEMPETRASLMQVKGHRVKAQSDTGSVHSVKTSKTDKIVIKGNSKPKLAQAGNTTSQSFNPPEGSRPAIQLGTASVSDSLLSQSLSAADLLRGNMAASRLSSPAGSKVSIPDSGKSGKSGSSQRRRKLKQEEVELEELGPLCLPKTSPIDIVSDWLRGIPAGSGMDNPEEEMNEGIEETEEEEEEQENTAETGQQEEEEEQENMAETGQQEEEEEQENTAETGQQDEEEEQENTAETGQQEEEEEEEQENTADTGQQEEEEEEKQENTAETGQQEEEEEQENTAETRQQEEEEEQENTAETGQQEEEEEQENTAETGQQEEEEEQENTAETGQQGEEEEQENTAETGQQEEEEEQENTAETGQQEEEEEQENTAETGQQDEEEEQENTAETGQEEEEEEQENTAETGQEEEEEEQENMAETGQEEEEQENMPETGQQDEEIKKAARQPEEEGEISPVYGRRLSSSAKGLLDCLAQLQLIDPPPSPAAAPGPDRDQRYQEVMDILESLWLSKPDLEKRKEGEAEGKERLKDSGVDLSSGSAGSGGSGKTRPDETETYGGGEGEIDGGGEEATSAELLSDAATPDIASQVQSSPGEDESSPESPPGTGEMLQTLERLKTPGSPSSSDSTAYKSPTDTETDTPEDTPSSGTPPSVQRPLLTKRVSQDPDPVWVLNLLKKLEKQFMTHYVDAMAELKVRWDLDNNVMLDTMITELRDEVKKRIQMSIDRELRKIRGRAGRGPRPPNMSRESTVTDQRRRRLKVMKVQSVNESDGEQGSGDVSDQRSEDEYCPCDACIRKKAEDKAIKMEAVVAKAPVMMAFDLRKILQMKKDPESPAPPSPTQGKNNDKLEEEEEQVGNLEVVQEDEEEEERKEDILPTVIEEDISEKEEEGVTGGEDGEEEGQESHGAESLMGEVEEEIAEEIGAEEQEEDGVVEGTEDEEEEAGEGETGCESAGEDVVEGAETGEGEELVEGEEEEAGEAEAGDQEKAGGDEAGDQEEAAGDEETGVAGETGGEEKTPEEETEVNVGVSAEDEEEGGEEEVQLNAVAEFNPEDEEGEEMEGYREIPLIHQMTRTSVESQPGSMENTDPEPRASDPVSQMCSLTLIEPNETVSDRHQMASAGEGSGGKGQRRSRSPARTKRRKPKENGIELDVLDL
uniref:uncharacterized protein LOC124046983 n=1 Tax=Oncorhynchus gorbuscha TaxID=8017 RepID=UPI001EAEA0B5|nr:uncharacterized protein LOC124046983 [Oncorhynchus gorbuscha]